MFVCVCCRPQSPKDFMRTLLSVGITAESLGGSQMRPEAWKTSKRRSRNPASWDQRRQHTRGVYIILAVALWQLGPGVTFWKVYSKVAAPVKKQKVFEKLQLPGWFLCMLSRHITRHISFAVPERLTRKLVQRQTAPLPPGPLGRQEEPPILDFG